MSVEIIENIMVPIRETVVIPNHYENDIITIYWEGAEIVEVSNDFLK